MPHPTASTAINRPDLGLVAMEYFLDSSQGGFVAQMVLPVFQTPVATGKYPVIPKEEFLKLVETRRASRAAFARGDWRFKDAQFACEERGFEEPIDDRERKLYEGLYAGLDVEQITTMIATDQMLRAYEKRVADLVINEASFTPHTAAAEWTDKDSADPRADVQAGIEAMEGATGLSPNALIMTKKIFRRVEECAAYIDHLKYTRAVLTESLPARVQLMAQYLDVDRVLLTNAIYNTSKNPDNFTTESIWPDNYAMLARLATQPRNLKEPCLGRTFLWTGNTPDMLTTEIYREEQTMSDIIRVRHDTDERFVLEACGYLLKGLSA